MQPRPDYRTAAGVHPYHLVLVAGAAALFLGGLLNAFIHVRDAWGAMPSGLVASMVATALAVAAVWFSVSGPRIGDAA